MKQMNDCERFERLTPEGKEKYLRFVSKHIQNMEFKIERIWKPKQSFYRSRAFKSSFARRQLIHAGTEIMKFELKISEWKGYLF